MLGPQVYSLCVQQTVTWYYTRNLAHSATDFYHGTRHAQVQRISALFSVAQREYTWVDKRPGRCKVVTVKPNKIT
jgi:hypothetical protein